MKQFLLATAALLAGGTAAGQSKSSPSVWAVDFAKANPGKLDSALTALALNWSAARQYAQKMNYVASYQLLKAEPAAADNAGFDIIMLTEYPNEQAYRDREKNFQVVFAKYQPGYVLLNGKKPGDFMRMLFSTVCHEAPRLGKSN